MTKISTLLAAAVAVLAPQLCVAQSGVAIDLTERELYSLSQVLNSSGSVAGMQCAVFLQSLVFAFPLAMQYIQSSPDGNFGTAKELFANMCQSAGNDDIAGAGVDTTALTCKNLQDSPTIGQSVKEELERVSAMLSRLPGDGGFGSTCYQMGTWIQKHLSIQGSNPTPTATATSSSSSQTPIPTSIKPSATDSGANANPMFPNGRMFDDDDAKDVQINDDTTAQKKPNSSASLNVTVWSLLLPLAAALVALGAGHPTF